MTREPDNIRPFQRDASRLGGYVYTASDKLSCRLATGRSLQVMLSANQFAGRSILDVGCGDGHFDLQIAAQGRPASLTGTDAARAAVSVAAGRTGQCPLRFLVANAHTLPFGDNSFDLALIQSILHHDDRPADLVREAFRVAPVILIHEPNGNNFGLKLIEKLSRYHREHGERSYTPRRIRNWVRDAGGEILWEKFAGFVPMFSPDWLAQSMKAVEPLLESTPLLSALGCALYVLVARRKP